MSSASLTSARATDSMLMEAADICGPSSPKYQPLAGSREPCKHFSLRAALRSLICFDFLCSPLRLS